MSVDNLRAHVAMKWQDAFARLNREQQGIAGLLEFREAWELTLRYLEPRELDNRHDDRFDHATLRTAFEIINASRRVPALMEVFLERVKKKFFLIQRDIEKYTSNFESTGDPASISLLLHRLRDWYNYWCPDEELGTTFHLSYNLAFQTNLFAILPASFVAGFKALISATLPTSGSKVGAEFLASKPQLWEVFDNLGFLDRYEGVIASAGYEHIEAHVIEHCTGKWAEPMMEGLRQWMQTNVVPWMLAMYGKGGANPDDIRVTLQNVGSRFDFHMARTISELRTREIFDIIIDYPDSQGALSDLKECLQRVDQRTALVDSLRKANKKRLLHPGADTRLILTQYVSTIKCLRVIDPPGVLLFKVADPIRRYLRERPDTIRCIVSNLVGDEDGGESLVDDSEPVPLQQVEIEDYSDPNWEPEPVDAGPEFRANKTSDIISTLVSIYDSKDLFVKELQVLLAQRLLAITDENFERVEKERRNIEILKIRFGEAALQVCEVMLKDMTDSKRIDGHVQSQKSSIVHPTIISKHFWPMLDSGDITMPGQFKELQSSYSKEFTAFKPDKKLRWLPHLGSVRMEIELQDRTIPADVPPLEAAFIELFSTKPIWSLDDLVAQVGSVDRTAALKALMTWVDRGVLKQESEGSFRLLEVAEAVDPKAKESYRAAVALESEPQVTVAQQQQAEQMRIHWKFIQAMLTNLGSLPLDRIQANLKFAPGYDRTKEQLAEFLEAARREGLVTVRDGMWRINPQ